ncbi:SNF2 domain-containing protein CLASSY 4-like [Heracleum sosnowskyi]|uniref:SNF2 domain-containing protein CLASSY 4-like n=1 Tax=Heracleum sosnowskyi TaxID=360622 RepID=A0AAD8H2X9_9APIA|nr:SNF2 domain-containing protein CLASSY 4-like [Heracleum sosnowskyi]
MDNKLPVAKRTRLGVDRMLYERYLEQRVKKSGAGAPVPEYGGVAVVDCVNVDWEDMDNKLPVAKRTRSGVDRMLYERCLEQRAKRVKKSGTGVPVPEYGSMSVVECVNVDWEEEDDEEFSEVKKRKSAKSRSKGKGRNVKKMEKIWHASDDDDDDDDDDVVLMLDSSNDGDDGCADDEYFSTEEIDSDVMVVSVVDKAAQGNEDERVVDVVVVDDEVEGCLSDSSPSEGENFYEEESDETYRGDSRSDDDEGLDDESSSCVNSEDEGEDVSSDDDEVKCRFWEKRDVGCKRKGRRADEGGEKIIKIGKSCCFVDVDDTDEERWTRKTGRNGGRKIEERIVKTGVKKTTELRDYEARGRILERNDVKCKGKEVVVMLSSSDDEIRGDDVKRDGRERRKQIAKKKKADNLDGLRILADSLHSKGEALKKFEEDKPKYKFWFKNQDEKPVEKTDLDKHLDHLFKELEMCLTFEQIGSTQLEVDNGDHCKTQTNTGTLCSQGIHHLVLDEQIGIICKFCSHVNQEIKHILPTFSKPSPQTRRAYFEQSGCPVYSNDFRYSGAGRHDSETYDAAGTVWDLVPGTRSSMYEHQREGFEFIWKNVVGGIIIDELEKPLSSSGSGCIISHAPGTGKTRLTIIFLQSFMKMYPDSRPVIIAPKSMLLTWEEEFKKWKINMPFHNLNNLEFSGQENPAAVSVSRKGRDSRNSENLTRLVKLMSWKMDQSILGITYALFDKLVRDATKNADCTPVVEQMGKALLKLPTLIVLDEGHTPRNNQSSIYNSLLDVETERRIILSGTPFQNNFDELYNTLRLVNPKFDGDMKKNLRNISKELKSKWSGHKLKELKGMISPFVHVHKGKILQKSCPGLKDALIRLQPTDLQQELIGVMSSKDLKAGYLELSYVISLVSVHPSLLPKRYFQEPQFSTYKDKLEKLERDPYSGAKTKFVVELCRMSEALNEKVLVYSQYIDPLIFIKKQLQTYFTWTEGREVLYMDGNTEAKQRQSLISSLNDPRSKVRVLLASIKACSEGIHLVGASRVVLLDVVWNPSVERQAISRAYRIGQKKMVYTYHLIGEEMDSKKFKIQTEKDRLSEIVFSSNDEDSCKENVPNIVCEDEILQQMFQHNDKLGGIFKVSFPFLLPLRSVKKISIGLASAWGWPRHVQLPA